jgi:hypothetical protein
MVSLFSARRLSPAHASNKRAPQEAGVSAPAYGVATKWGFSP